MGPQLVQSAREGKQRLKALKYLDNVWESVEIVISDDVMIFYEFHHSSTKSDQEFGRGERIPRL